MSDSNTTATGAGTNTGSAAGNPASEGSPNTPQAVSIEEFAALKKQNDFLAKQFREINQKLSTFTPAPAKSEDDEPKTVREGLTKLQAEIKADREAIAQERREVALQQAVNANGVDADNAELLLDHISQRYGKNIKVDGRKVYHEDPVTGETAEIKDFVADLLKGPKGDRFRSAAKPGPKPVSGQRPRASSASSFLDMPQEERIKLQRENPAEYMRRMQAAAKE